MHSFLNTKANPYVDAGYSTFTAEVASTFNERLLIRHLLEKPGIDDETRLYLLGEQLEGIRTTIYRQTLFAEFERRLHELAEAGTPITAELLTKTYGDLVRKYYGPGFAMGPNDGVEWTYIPHFYWKFYVFAYATGLSSGIALADKVAAGDEAARKGYLAMLEEPSSSPPLAALKKTGLDLPDAIEAALKLMNQTITEMEQIAAKRGTAASRR
jgi:oligoendopeptidase F